MAVYNLENRWTQFCSQFSCDQSLTKEIFDFIYDAYTEEGRQYHDLDHIAECLETLDSVSDVGDRIASELALWFHDFVYNPRSHINEETSAAVGHYYTYLLTGDSELAKSVHKLIMATKHDGLIDFCDASLVCDIDLTRLASPRFAEYSRGIRYEYLHIPEELYMSARKKALENFLYRDKIYLTDCFSHLESAARTNLQHAIAEVDIYLQFDNAVEE